VTDEDRCAIWDGHSQRRCRNKRFSGRVCRRHLIARLRRFEDDNRELATYLKYRHLLADDLQEANG
jgi:hypothetical protein